MPEQSAADVKLVQYLNEAYGLEKHLEIALQAHIAMTTGPPYKKRLRAHLSETKRHAREVKQAIKRLGGVAETVSAPGPEPVAEVAQVVLSGAQKAAALAQGSLQALRGTGEEEKQLKNAKTEYASESQEIATYLTIETLAQSLKDTETQRLARSIRRDEERMRAFLEKEIPRLTKAVRKAEIPPVSSRAKTSTSRPASKKPAAVVKKPLAGKSAALAKKAAVTKTAPKAPAAKRKTK